MPTRSTRGGAMRRRSDAPIDAVLALVKAARGDPGRVAALVDFLRDEHEVYSNRSASDVVRLRGYVMQAFSDLGLPEKALPFVLEDLESSFSAYAVAAAARALRGWVTPSVDARPALLRALDNLKGTDEYISFAEYGAVGDPATGSTATAEVHATLRWLERATGAVAPRSGEDRKGAVHAGCCHGSAENHAVSRLAGVDRVEPSHLLPLAFEDHDCRTITFGELFTGRPSIVVFFYTRCENPRKCSLTIEKLGRLQVSLGSAGLAERVRIAAISYDPRFDSPSRLKAYAVARGFRPGDNHCLLRAKRGMQDVRDYFSLGVNYVHSVVNRHRIELYLLDATARVAASFLRLEWDEAEVLDEARRLLDSGVGGR